jgi:hypothetical protein
MAYEKQEINELNSFRLTAKVMLILNASYSLAEAAGFGFVPGAIVRPLEE